MQPQTSFLLSYLPLPIELTSAGYHLHYTININVEMTSSREGGTVLVGAGKIG